MYRTDVFGIGLISLERINVDVRSTMDKIDEIIEQIGQLSRK